MAQLGFRPYNMLPEVIKNLLIINVLVFVTQYVLSLRFEIDLVEYLALHFPTSEKYHFFQWFTYMFLHADISHLFFNMFTLWMFGSTVEHFIREKKMLFLYFSCGLGAAIVELLVLYGSTYYLNMDRMSFSEFSNALVENPMQYSLIGASGAVYGILAAYAYLFPNNTVYIYFLIPIKIKYLVILMFVFDFYSGITGGSNIAHFAHLGGALIGFLLIRKWKQNGLISLY